MATRRRVLLVDTSAAVAAMVGDHEAHAQTIAALKNALPGLAGHAWFESFSVLTRLPPPRRRSPDAVVRALQSNFPETRWLSEAGSRALAERAAELGLSGGSIYDALVGAVAAAEGLPLLTRDVRAVGTYQAIGARTVFID